MVTLMTEYIWLCLAILSLGLALPTRRLIERCLEWFELWACERIERRMSDKPIFMYGSHKTLFKK